MLQYDVRQQLLIELAPIQLRMQRDCVRAVQHDDIVRPFNQNLTTQSLQARRIVRPQ